MQKNVEKYLEKRAKDLAEEWVERVWGIVEAIKLTPIESLFYIEWEKETASRYDEIPLYYYDNERMPFLYPQWELEVKKGKEKKKYRVDFLIIMKDLRNWDEPDKKENTVIIEIDSYLWHGSTPEQFTKEKERERELTNAGYKIIRFSGREVYKNPIKCVEDAMSFAHKVTKGNKTGKNA